jgi:hypothetical protein
MILNELKNIKSTQRELRQFGLTVGAVLLILGAILYYYGRPAAPYCIGVGSVLAALGLVYPAILFPLQKVWMAIAVLLGWVMTRVILMILFYFVFTPIRMISILFGKSFLDLKRDSAAPTYWNRREETEGDPSRHERQF